ncbi:MAG: AAC(3) family N-acetyltransferase, partial [Anaerolineae bacterium]|nr:AAC(3) family N-acetyltransferase [Anaerolineae bacterium]
MQAIKRDASHFFVADIEHILNAVGVPQDATLFFHADAESMGLSQAQAEALVVALIAAVGPQATLVMPTLTAREGRPRPPFNPLTSPSDCGIISETFRQLPGAIRSHHTTYSAAVLGPQAQALTKSHRLARGRPSIWGESAFGDASPWYQMYAQDTWCICVGVPWSENVWKPFIQSRYVELHQGLTKSTPYPPLDMERAGQVLEAEGIARRLALAGSPAIVFRIGAAVNRVVCILDDAPERVLPEERTPYHVW